MHGMPKSGSSHLYTGTKSNCCNIFGYLLKRIEKGL